MHNGGRKNIKKSNESNDEYFYVEKYGNECPKLIVNNNETKDMMKSLTRP